jgi:peptidoglycan biosynthesis protein MviN/MurJ (putative lipid II flippase)
VSGRPPAALLLALTALLVASAPVFAHDGGEGLWGETDDKVVTNAGFILIIFFPLFIALMSLLQSQLDKRKQRRKAAAKAREQAPGGW